MKYKHMPEKLARVYEVFLPKKMSYASKLAEVLDAFITPDGVENIPAVKTVLASIQGTHAESIRKQFLDTLRKAISGYSIYEVDGRFNTDAGPIDERVWVIRFIIHDPDQPIGMSGSFLSTADAIITHLVSSRFAKELGTEEEVWVLRYDHCYLQRWVKDGPSKDGPSV